MTATAALLSDAEVRHDLLVWATRYCRLTGTTGPSLAELRTAFGLSRAALSRHLDALVGAGALEWDRASDGQGVWVRGVLVAAVAAAAREAAGKALRQLGGVSRGT